MVDKGTVSAPSEDGRRVIGEKGEDLNLRRDQNWSARGRVQSEGLELTLYR
jgi:hypothetical protein